MAALFRADERRFALAVARIAYENPFGPGRIESERQALGGAFTESGAVWSPDGAHLESFPLHAERPNVIELRDRSFALAQRLRERLEGPRSGLSAEDLELYEDLSLFALFARYEFYLFELAINESAHAKRVAFYPVFRRDFERLLVEPGLAFPSGLDARSEFLHLSGTEKCGGVERRPHLGHSPHHMRSRAFGEGREFL